MDKNLIFFLLGILLGLWIPFVQHTGEIDNLVDDPETVIQKVFTVTANIWHLIFSILILIGIPFVVFKQLRDRFTEKQFLPFPFMIGNTFGFTFMTIIGMLLGKI